MLPEYNYTELLEKLESYKIGLTLINDEMLRNQREFEAQSAKWLEIFELSPTGYLVITKEGIIENANLSTCIMLDTNRSTLICKQIFLYIHKDDRQILHLYMHNNTSSACQVRIMRKDKGILWVQLSANKLEDGNYCLSLTDITDIHNSLDALKAVIKELE
jgi:PAS domain S-box-containing protein